MRLGVRGLPSILILAFLGAGSYPALGQPGSSVPVQYRKYFFLRADQRSLLEKALNLVGMTEFPVGRSFALIAGVSQYPNFDPLDKSLKPAEVDLENLKTYLKEQEFFDEIVVLKDGEMNFTNLSYFLETYFPNQLSASPHSRFLFAYSGHGYSTKVGSTNRGYLLTSAANGLKDPINRLDLDVLRTLLGSSVDSAEKALVLINSCDSGAFLGRKAFGANPLGPGDRGAHAIMASRSEQNSLHLDSVGPGSVFFEKFFAGLRGPADRSPADGVVTYHELDTYLHQEIPYVTNGQQIPMEGDISRDGSVGEFFFLNRGRQMSFGNAPPWNPKSAVAFGTQAADVLAKGKDSWRSGKYADALKLYKLAAAKGNTGAMFALGLAYASGNGVQQDFTQARAWYEKAAAAGDASAINNLGAIYNDGKGVTPDFAQARRLFERAAADGVAASMGNLGTMYAVGRGVTQDFHQAREWFEKAANAGDAQSMHDLGGLYAAGNGVPQDYRQARAWYEKAAGAGYAPAMYALGYFSAQGQGVTQDYAEAHVWYEKAAAAHEPSAMYALGIQYAFGQGVTKNFAQARQWYEKAAAGGDAAAMYNLGLIYEFGLGVQTDNRLARQWYELAANSGDKDARDRVQGIGK